MSSAAPIWAPRYTYSDPLVLTLCAVAEAKARVELLPLPPDESLRLRHAAYQRSTRSSTRIEGNSLDDDGVRQAVAAADREGSKAEQEVRNYWRALDRVEEWAQGSGPLSEAWIQELHAVVIVRGRGRRRQRTSFRDHEVPVVDTLSRRIDYAPPRPEDVGPLMHQLCAWWQASGWLPPLVRAALLSHRFISIHPCGPRPCRPARSLRSPTPGRGSTAAASSCSRACGRGWRRGRSRRISSSPQTWRSGLRCRRQRHRTGCTSGRSMGCWSPPGRGSGSAAGGCASRGGSGF